MHKPCVHQIYINVRLAVSGQLAGPCSAQGYAATDDVQQLTQRPLTKTLVLSQILPACLKYENCNLHWWCYVTIMYLSAECVAVCVHARTQVHDE